MTNRIQIGTVGTLLLFSLLALNTPPLLAKTSQGETRQKDTPQAQPIRVEKVQHAPAGDTIRTPATTRACQRTELAFQVGGQLLEIPVKPGDTIQKGQLLMRLDSRDYQDNVAVLKAKLAEALSRQQTARLDFKRAEELFAQKVIPQADFDHSHSNRKSAAAQVAQLKAHLSLARRQLAHTTLFAPYDGIVTHRLAEKYEMVKTNQAVIGLHDISRLEIVGNIPENDLVRFDLREGRQVEVSFPALGNQRFPAMFSEWKSAASPSGRTFETVFTLKRPPLPIYPGMTAELHWQKTTANTFSVPARAVIGDGANGSLVWIYDNKRQRARRQPVTVSGFAGEDRLSITDGLQGKELIITDGMEQISENTPLRCATNTERDKR